jgi:hypothetical protein
MQERLFRKSSLERLASPDQLDELIRVTSPRAWLALLGMLLIVGAAAAWGIFGTIATTLAVEGILIHEGEVHNVISPASGVISEIHFSAGDLVIQGQTVAQLIDPEADEPIRIISDHTGRVLEVRAGPGSAVQADQPVITLEAELQGSGRLLGVIYLTPSESREIRPGMPVRIAPTAIRAEETGILLGRVASVGQLLETSESMYRLLRREDLVRYFSQAVDGLPIAVRVELEVDPETVSGYRWSSPQGANVQVRSGTLFEATIIIEEQAPIQMIFPELGFWRLRWSS